ncbi:MAG: hypothetical protein OYL41_14575 [Acidobacteriota bacterium]|nr:hypothetical protein [Acidobacteriota bacterium]
MSALPGPEPVGGRRIGRRRLLGLRVCRIVAQRSEVGRSRYAGWIAQYRRGRLEEVDAAVRTSGTRPLLSAQRDYLDSLGEPDTVRGLQARLSTALFHAELAARFGERSERRLHLVGEPLRAIPARWPRGIPADLRASAREAWGVRPSEDLRALLRREVFLMAARSRLARLDIRSARQVLSYAVQFRDPAAEWQLATTSAFQARYLRDDHLWPDARGGLRDGVSRWAGRLPEPGVSPRAIVQAMADPDDLHLRLVLVALGRGYRRAAVRDLQAVRDQVAPRLLVPRLLLEAELDLAEGRVRPAIDGLQVAIRTGPTSPAAVAALVAALQAAGRWDEAAALASDLLSVREKARPWLAFLTSWAEFGEGLPWLRQMAGIA